MKTVQKITIAGTLAGAAYTVAPPLLQLAGLFTATQDFEILGFRASFFMQMDYSIVPPVFPVGALLYNFAGNRIAYPNSPLTTAAQNQTANFLALLTPVTVYQPAGAYAGSPVQLLGSANESFTFPSGQTISVRSGSSISVYLRLAGTTIYNSASMVAGLLVYI